MSEQPLRILQILRAPVGGLFRHVRDLTTELGRRGHAVGVVVDSLRSDGLSAERLATLKDYVSLGIHSMPIPRVLGPGDFTTPFKIRRLAKDLDIDVLHGHGAKGGLNARLARIGPNKRVSLYTPHGGVLNYKVGSPVGVLFRLIEQGLVPITDSLVFESAFAQRAFDNQIGLGNARNAVIYNGLSPSEFEPIPFAPDARDFVFIGELRAVKGVDVLLKAIVDVRAPDGRPVTAILAGDGPDRPEIEALVKTLELDGRITLAGVQPARKMLALGRCLVVPSLAESLPYVILEGSSANRPVISTDVGGISEIFGPTSGSLLRARDIDGLRRALQDFMDDPAGAQAEADTRLAYISDRFSLKHMVDEIEKLYRACLAAR
jgi:glycosyltransferase involved in cell wall biosynthesis